MLHSNSQMLTELAYVCDTRDKTADQLSLKDAGRINVFQCKLYFNNLVEFSIHHRRIVLEF